MSSWLMPYFGIALISALATPVLAAGVSIHVTDRNGDPVRDVAAYLVPATDTLTKDAMPLAPPTATIEQINNAFVPHMLVVETGTQISFPNNDTVSHHVYSFSEAKRFQLDLYRGDVHPPQVFDAPGLVVLGCNIHDSMLAWILVVDSPWSAITGENGIADLNDLPPGAYELFVWTPRAKQKDLPSPQLIEVGESDSASVSVRLSARLSPPLTGLNGSLSWESY